MAKLTSYRSEQRLDDGHELLPVLGGGPQQSGTDQDVVRAKLPELLSQDWDFGDSQVEWPRCSRQSLSEPWNVPWRGQRGHSTCESPKSQSWDSNSGSFALTTSWSVPLCCGTPPNTGNSSCPSSRRCSDLYDVSFAIVASGSPYGRARLGSPRQVSLLSSSQRRSSTIIHAGLHEAGLEQFDGTNGRVLDQDLSAATPVTMSLRKWTPSLRSTSKMPSGSEISIENRFHPPRLGLGAIRHGLRPPPSPLGALRQPCRVT